MATWMRNSTWGIPVLYVLMVITAMPPLSGFGTLVTVAGMAFAHAGPEQAKAGVTWGQSLWQFTYGWLVASLGLILSATIGIAAIRFILTRLRGRWDVMAMVQDDPRFNALQEAVRTRGLWMAVLAR